MDLSHRTTVKTVAVLLLLAAISQPIYTALYLGAPEVDRRFLWGLEGLLFVVLSAFAGSALVMAKRYTLGFSAIAFSAVLNVVQVGVGLTQFAPFREAAAANPDLGGVAFSVVAFSFFGYNAAKILLGLAAISLIPAQAYLIPKLQVKVNALNKERVQRIRGLSEEISEAVAGVEELRAQAATQ